MSLFKQTFLAIGILVLLLILPIRKLDQSNQAIPSTVQEITSTPSISETNLQYSTPSPAPTTDKQQTIQKQDAQNNEASRSKPSPELLPSPSPIVPTQTIDLGSVIGIICNVYTYNTRNGKYEFTSISAGSGVIVTSDGLALTNRHVVDPLYQVRMSGEKTTITKFDQCYADFPYLQAEKYKNYDSSGYENVYAKIQYPFRFKVDVRYIPQSSYLSNKEYINLDFATIKLSYRDDVAHPNEQPIFPYSRIFVDSIPQPRDEILVIGYPMEGVTDKDSTTFGEFQMIKELASIDNINYGDSLLHATPLYYQYTYSQSINRGRAGTSGGPIFWRGNLIGMNMAGGKYYGDPDTGNLGLGVTMQSILYFLKQTQ